MAVAEVKIWGELAGAVSWNENTGLASFEYCPDFKKLNWELAPLKMPGQFFRLINYSASLSSILSLTSL